MGSIATFVNCLQKTVLELAGLGERPDSVRVQRMLLEGTAAAQEIDGVQLAVWRDTAQQFRFEVGVVIHTLVRNPIPRSMPGLAFSQENPERVKPTEASSPPEGLDLTVVDDNRLAEGDAEAVLDEFRERRLDLQSITVQVDPQPEPEELNVRETQQTDTQTNKTRGG